MPSGGGSQRAGRTEHGAGWTPGRRLGGPLPPVGSSVVGLSLCWCVVLCRVPEVLGAWREGGVRGGPATISAVMVLVEGTLASCSNGSAPAPPLVSENAIGSPTPSRRAVAPRISEFSSADESPHSRPQPFPCHPPRVPCSTPAAACRPKLARASCLHLQPHTGSASLALAQWRRSSKAVTQSGTSTWAPGRQFLCWRKRP